MIFQPNGKRECPQMLKMKNCPATPAIESKIVNVKLIPKTPMHSTAKAT